MWTKASYREALYPDIWTKADGKKRLPRRTGISYIASFFNKKKNIDTFESLPSSIIEGEPLFLNEDEPRFFSYQELEKATKCFKQSIGVGGYGRVYLGQLANKRMIAVKELIDDNPKQLQEFFNEVAILSRLRHPNLVKLYGCTNPLDQKMLLVYEFVPNGTLFDHLHGQVEPLPWSLRMRIALETSEALYYLHSAQPPIIHRDVKPQNILLDNDHRVKVADFGLCRQLPLGMKNMSTQTPGTMGYQDPEYQRTITLTEKSDVYSFGVLLLELISGQKAVDENRDIDNTYLDYMALNMIKDKELELLVDPELGYQTDACVRRKINCVVELAQNCLQRKGYMRPSMGEVLKILRGLQDEMQDIEVQKCVEEQNADLYCFKEQASNDEQEKTDEQEEEANDEQEKTDEQEEEANDEQEKTDEQEEEANPFHRSQRLGLASIFTYEELKKATNNFHISQKLCNFANSRLYLGILDGLMVTVKLLDDDNPYKIVQFFNEVSVHSFCRHKNLMTLYGCTSPDSKKLLIVYEFMPNGTVADHLHGQRQALSWDVRIQIAIKTAEALANLQSLNTSIVHRDVTTSNILLDNTFNVKLTGLDICEFLTGGTTYTDPFLVFCGTKGYREDEFISLGEITKKSDIFSFGVVLFELISGEKALDVNREPKYLRDMALNMIENNQLNQFVDPKLGYRSDKELRRMINMVADLACKCLQKREDLRPSIGEVLCTLEEIRKGGNKQS